jgi:hypothetical protein
MSSLQTGDRRGSTQEMDSGSLAPTGRPGAHDLRSWRKHGPRPAPAFPAPRPLALRLRPLALGIFLTAAALLALAAPPAQAATTHNFLSSLTEAPPATKLQEPTALAIDHATGHVFVSDLSAGVIDVYGPSGTYLTQIGAGSLFATGVAVDEASGLVYAADSFENAVLAYKPKGSGYELLSEWTGEALPAQEFGEITGLAVDNSASASAGDLYVIDAEDPELSVGVADVFKPNGPGPEEGAEGSLVRVLSAGKMEEPNGVAVDGASGKVYIADSAKGSVYEFSSTGAAEGKLNGKGAPNGTFSGPEEEEGNVSAVAIDPSTGDLLVAEAERHLVSEFNAAGEWVGQIINTPSGPLGETFGVAASASGGVYVSDTSLARVELFGPGVIVPDVITSKASKLTRTTASLNGTINGLGKAGHYFFQYGTTEALGSSTTPTAFAGGEEKVAVALSELHAGQSYFFRLVAENENATNYGIVREFETPTAVEGLSTGPVTNLQPTSATLTGALSPNGFDAHYYFQWGATTTYGSESPSPPGTDAGEGAGAVAALTNLEDLKANTVYHYRLIGTNSLGTTFGSDQKFQTSGPPRITNKPTTAIGHEEATINAEVNADELETKYRFEYGESSAYGSEVPLGGASVGSGASPVAVSATLTKLKLGVSYHFRVVAENSAGTTNGPDQSFTTVPPAPVDATFATEVGATEATLHAQINPLGNATTYYFQYGTSSCKANPSACTDIPAAPGQDIGSGSEDVAESQKLTGLQPDTTYFYRVIAINALGSTEGPERTLTTKQPTSTFALPDGRAWEMVSPPNKAGAPVEALTREGGVILAAEDGNRLTYVVDGALGEDVQGNRSPEWQQVLATRRGSEWSSQDIATPSSKAKGATAGQAPEYQFFTPNLSSALVEPAGLAPEPPLAPGVTQATMYLRDNAIGTYLPLVTNSNVAPGTTFGTQVHFLSATADLSHVVISSAVALTGPGSGAGLYEWSAGKLQLVSLLPDGTTPAKAAELGFSGRILTHAISSDGSRVVWTNKEDLSTRGGHLYMRDTIRGQTLRLDVAQGVAEPAGAGVAQFQGASSDGAGVFFTDKQRLTADSTAEPGQGTGKPDLYECVIIEEAGQLACRLKDLTVDHNEGEHAAVQGLVLGTSEDVTSTFLVAQGVLASNQNGNGEAATSGKNNLYALHFDGSQWTTTFIATLSSEDSAEWEGNKIANSAYLTARTSPNGRYLAFMSSASITGYDNVDASPEAKGARDQEVFLYDSQAASLRCVSCNPSGARPKGVLDQNESGEGLGLLVDRRKIWLGHYLAGNIPGWTAQSLTSALFQSRYLSDEGRLYFNSPDSLVPAVSRHAENVYEYEPSGVGNCESSSGGCVSLLTPGTSEKESAFIEATPDASSVFFASESQLLPQDTDSAFDIYDARECSSGSPCLTIPTPPPGGCTEAETCRPASPPQSIPGGPGGSATFSGPGNATAPAAKGQVQGVKGANPTAKPKPLTRAQRLTNALKACKKQHQAKKRKSCEAHARKLYGAKGKKAGWADAHRRASHSSDTRSSGRGGR